VLLVDSRVVDGRPPAGARTNLSQTPEQKEPRFALILVLSLLNTTGAIGPATVQVDDEFKGQKACTDAGDNAVMKERADTRAALNWAYICVATGK
jgi:hypothetical protein